MSQNIYIVLHLTANVLVHVCLDIFNILHSFLQIPNSINHHFSSLWRTFVCISWGVSVKTHYLIVCLKISLFCFPHFKDNFIGYRTFGWTDFFIPHVSCDSFTPDTSIYNCFIVFLFGWKLIFLEKFSMSLLQLFYTFSYHSNIWIISYADSVDF